MPYKKFQCPRGHQFNAYTISSLSIVTCEECRQKVLSRNGQFGHQLLKYQFLAGELEMPVANHPKEAPNVGDAGNPEHS
jgi:hypothetical protein